LLVLTLTADGYYVCFVRSTPTTEMLANAQGVLDPRHFPPVEQHSGFLEVESEPGQGTSIKAFLFCSGVTAGTLTQQMLDAPHVALLAKPFSEEALLLKVRALLDAAKQSAAPEPR
jgi:hypothetical protein